MRMKTLLNAILPEADYIDNGYYSWLLSPKGKPMQIDRLYPDLKLAFEYNGKQHYYYNPRMHRSRKAFAYLKACDRQKAKILKARGYCLITIRYDRKLTKEYLIRRLRQAGILDELKRKTRVVDH